MRWTPEGSPQWYPPLAPPRLAPGLESSSFAALLCSPDLFRVKTRDMPDGRRDWLDMWCARGVVQTWGTVGLSKTPLCRL